MDKQLLSYSIGALLYCPANNKGIFNSIINQRFGTKFTLALCLEDTIRDDFVLEAEADLIATLKNLYSKKDDFFIPKIFIRVRTPNQIVNLYDSLGTARDIVTGFIAPKFALDVAQEYIDKIKEVNINSQKPVYFMPIFESTTVINLQNRYNILYSLKDKLEQISDLVVNIRVGGNDLCHAFGIRRNSQQSIYSILPIASILSDIITVFGMEYVVAGPVWEYYNGADWVDGLRNELEHDKLNGFIGKTVIHPNQIPIVNDSYKVTKEDYKDATAILNWSDSNSNLVSGSAELGRMNEYKTHFNWANKILYRAKVYGVL